MESALNADGIRVESAFNADSSPEAGPGAATVRRTGIALGEMSEGFSVSSTERTECRRVLVRRPSMQVDLEWQVERDGLGEEAGGRAARAARGSRQSWMDTAEFR